MDISETLEQKLAAVRCYQTQFPPAKAYIFDRIRGAAMIAGAMAGFQAGETFVCTRPLGTQDLMEFGRAGEPVRALPEFTPLLQTVAARRPCCWPPTPCGARIRAAASTRKPEHPYRGPFQRDRDRVVHSSAYRRLSGKMQVFTGEMGDYHRTRLTHTHEVASIARTIGRALRLNEDLIEALALFHDIGHPPFGHAGEEALDECLHDKGGFSHNRYALTIAEELEERYQSFPGLNLTREVLESQAFRIDKHAAGPAPLLEAQVVESADSITYNSHDTDDSVKLELVTLDELAEIPLIARDDSAACTRPTGRCAANCSARPSSTN